jgi:hypothetical protein
LFEEIHMSLSKFQVMRKILKARSPEERSRIAKEFGRRGGTVAAVRKQRQRDNASAVGDQSYWWNRELLKGE